VSFVPNGVDYGDRNILQNSSKSTDDHFGIGVGKRQSAHLTDALCPIGSSVVYMVRASDLRLNGREFEPGPPVGWYCDW